MRMTTKMKTMMTTKVAKRIIATITMRVKENTFWNFTVTVVQCSHGNLFTNWIRL